MTTAEIIALALGVANLAGVSIARFVYNGLIEKIAEAKREAKEAHAELVAFKERVASEYVRNGYLKDVEDRLTDMFKRLDGKMDVLLSRHGSD